MSGNDNNVSIPLEELSADPSRPGQAATPSSVETDREGHVDDLSTDTSVATAPPRPPLWTALTVYKLINVIAIFAFCLKKDLLAYNGLTIEPTTLDLVSGMLGVVLYWIGQYDGVKKLDWFFKFDLARPIVDCAKRAFREGKHVLMTSRLYWIDQYEGVKKLEWSKFDLAHPIVICAKRVFGEVTGALFFYNGLFINISVGNLLGNLVVLLLVRSHPRVHGAALWVVYLSIFGCALVFWYLVNAFIRRVRERGQESESTTTMRFITRVVGPAPLAEQHGWFRVRMIVKSFCGVSLVGLSLVAYFYLAWSPLCVNYNAHMTFYLPEGLSPVILVDYIDSRCTRALTLWQMAHPKDRSYPMWEQFKDDESDAFLSPHVHRENPHQLVTTEGDVEFFV